ncbi:hypothetical protein PV10_08786 [Exophiala mesophila]|uniref:Uncharacterized protein n=1 Tax=Exophiala mesophila TaxID=212818 RepID=A0A0D1ZQY6_EXOME|nr:uncharacterized protein PV10_08786 [Exophiala mesophila]KIV89198.1 hypothetical protein PV10_08786 [Exophiala mesophila]
MFIWCAQKCNSIIDNVNVFAEMVDNWQKTCQISQARAAATEEPKGHTAQESNLNRDESANEQPTNPQPEDLNAPVDKSDHSQQQSSEEVEQLDEPLSQCAKKISTVFLSTSSVQTSSRLGRFDNHGILANDTGAASLMSMCLHTMPKYLVELHRAHGSQRDYSDHPDFIHSVMEDLESIFANWDTRELPMKFITRQYAIQMVQDLLETGLMPTKLAYHIIVDLFHAGQSMSDIAEPLTETLIEVEARVLDTPADLQDSFCLKAIAAYPHGRMDALHISTFSRWLIMLLDKVSNPYMLMAETKCFRNPTYLSPLQDVDLDLLINTDLTRAMVAKALGTDDFFLANSTRLAQGEKEQTDWVDGGLPKLMPYFDIMLVGILDHIRTVRIGSHQDEVALKRDIKERLRLAAATYPKPWVNERLIGYVAILLGISFR